MSISRLLVTHLKRKAEEERDTRIRSFAVRRTAIIEMALFFVVALAIDFVFLDGNRYQTVSPHPFWLIVLLMCFQYGTNEGLAAALSSIIILLAWNLPEQSVQQDQYSYLLDISLGPISWMVASVVFGELRMRQINERDELRQTAAEAAEREAVITKQYEDLQQIKQTLESRVAGQLKTVFSTYRAAKQIESLGVAKVLLGVADLVDAVMAPEKHSIFLLQEDVLQAGFGRGWTEEDHFIRHFDTTDVFFQELIGGQRFVSVVEDEGREILGDQGVMAGPMVVPESGEVIGVLKIERMSFLDFNTTAFENFKLLCEWIATAYANARNYEQASLQSAYDPSISMMTGGFFDRQSEFITSVARRINIDVSVLLIRIKQVNDSAELSRQELSKALGQCIEDTLRNTDLAFNRRLEGYDYAAILPNTPQEDVERVAEKLQSAFGSYIGEAAAGAYELETGVQPLFIRELGDDEPQDSEDTDG